MKVTVNNQYKEEVIDWNKVQLVVNNYNKNCIVLVTDIQSESTEKDFSGVNLEDGDYSIGWSKNNFKPFHGSITLQND